MSINRNTYGNKTIRHGGNELFAMIADATDVRRIFRDGSRSAGLHSFGQLQDFTPATGFQKSEQAGIDGSPYLSSVTYAPSFAGTMLNYSTPFHRLLDYLKRNRVPLAYFAREGEVSEVLGAEACGLPTPVGYERRILFLLCDGSVQQETLPQIAAGTTPAIPVTFTGRRQLVVEDFVYAGGNPFFASAPVWIRDLIDPVVPATKSLESLVAHLTPTDYRSFAFAGAAMSEPFGVYGAEPLSAEPSGGVLYLDGGAEFAKAVKLPGSAQIRIPNVGLGTKHTIIAQLRLPATGDLILFRNGKSGGIRITGTASVAVINDSAGSATVSGFSGLIPARSGWVTLELSLDASQTQIQIRVNNGTVTTATAGTVTLDTLVLGGSLQVDSTTYTANGTAYGRVAVLDDTVTTAEKDAIRQQFVDELPYLSAYA